MSAALPDFAEVTITAAELAEAIPLRAGHGGCWRDPVALAFNKAFPAFKAQIGYRGAHLFPRQLHTGRAPDEGEPAAVYRWNDRRLERLITWFDAGRDDDSGRLLPVTVHVQRVR